VGHADYAERRSVLVSLEDDRGPAQRGPNGLTDTPGAPPAGPSHRARAQDHTPREPGRERALSRPSLPSKADIVKPPLARAANVCSVESDMRASVCIRSTRAQQPAPPAESPCAASGAASILRLGGDG